MLGEPSRPTIPAPKQWPSRARSSVLHAISLAHFTLTFTRSWAANSLNARIRPQQDNDRLRQELALLREEMRIKGSRMLRISAQRRRHGPAAERLAILELRARPGLVPYADCETSSGHDRHGLFLDRPSRRGRPEGARPDPRAGQQVPEVRRVHRPQAEGAEPPDGQGQDRPGPLPDRAAPRLHDRPHDADAEAQAEAAVATRLALCCAAGRGAWRCRAGGRTDGGLPVAPYAPADRRVEPRGVTSGACPVSHERGDRSAPQGMSAACSVLGEPDSPRPVALSPLLHSRFETGRHRIRAPRTCLLSLVRCNRYRC